MTKNQKGFYHAFDKVKSFGMIFSGSVVFLMMLYTCVDVVFRNIQGYSPLYAYEISQSYFMPLIVFPGLAYTFSSGIMPRIDLLIVKFRESIQKTVYIIMYVIELVLLLALIVFGSQYLLSAIEKSQSFTAGGANLLLWPVILFVPIGFLLVFIEIMTRLVHKVKE